MRKLKFFIGLLASSVAVTGCTVSQKASGHVDQTRVQATQGFNQSSAPLPAADKSAIKVHDGVFVGNKSVRNENGDPLPAQFQRAKGIEIVRVNPVGLREIGAEITKETKIPLVLSAAVPGGRGGPATSATAQDMSAGASAPPSGLASGPLPANFPLDQALAEIQGSRGVSQGGGGGGMITASSLSLTESSIPLNYTGPLSGLLDIVSAHFNVAWRYEGGKIVLDQYVSRSFDVPALSVAATSSFEIGSSSSSEGGNGGISTNGNSSASTKTDVDVFAELNDGVAKLVGEDGGYSVNKVTGVVTVTATPATVNRVAKFIEGMNERLSDQVAMSVKVYSVTLTDSEAFNLDIAGIFRKAGKYGINVGTAAATNGVVPAVGSEGAGFGWALLNPSSEWYGTNALVDALSTAGKVSEVRNLNQVTLNGIPVPIQVGELRDYVSKVEKTTSDTGDSFTVETANVSTGFSMQLAPRIQRDGDVILQYGLNISELVGTEDGFDSYTTPDGMKLQLRRMKQRNFIQQARIPNGNTLVLAGFDQVKSKDNRRGAGNANFPLFGGGREASVEHEIIVIAITPTVLKK